MIEISGGVTVGDKAPEFALPSLQGKRIDLSSYRGQQHVVLWFSRGFTCNFCRNYMQSVIDAYPALQAADIEVIQVAPNLLDSARAYFDAGPPFPFVCDPDKRMYAVYGLGDRGVLEATKNMVISIGADIVGKLSQLTPKQQEVMERISRTADYMNELVTDLLDLGKIEAGINLEIKTIDLVPLIEDVIRTQQPTVMAKAQTMTVDLPQTLPALGDGRRLHQVLSNLVGNAVKYTPDAGEITVSGRLEGDQVDVQVQDTGIGIPAKDLPYIFDKFYRVQSPEMNKIKGTGLGLAIVKSIVEAHNGRITAASVPRQGSTFTVRLPGPAA